jgi:malate dehydrogenase (oxaloacetate-decarboxylating)
MDEWEVAARVAAATAMAAQAQGVARLPLRREAAFAKARATIQAARQATAVLMREGCIPPVPEA